MTNKEFKVLIKTHKVHQSFIVIGPKKLLRYYKDTVTDDNYISEWRLLEDETVSINVHKIDSDAFTLGWLAYANVVVSARKNVPACVNVDDYPMQQRKFWKLYNDTIKFMLFDKRVEVM